MAGKSEIEVLIGGKVYYISGYESEEYLQKVASYINNKISDKSDKILHFEQNNCDIEADVLNGIKDKISAAIPAGTTPTMAFCYPDHVAEYMQSNAVINLDTYINSEELCFTEEYALSSIISTYLISGSIDS